MQPSQATRWITDARFAPYLAQADGDHVVAAALYVWNARVSAAMFEAFPAGSGQRTEVAKLMSNLVPFRNRLAHHETILRRPIASHHEEMLTLAGLIDPDARAWIESASRVERVLSERPDIS